MCKLSWLALFCFEAAKYEIQKPSTCRATLIVSLQVFVVSRYSPCAINLARNKHICCGLKEVVAKSTAPAYFEQQSLALLLVFHQTHNLSRYKFRHIRSTPSKSSNQCAAKLMAQGGKRETSTKTCNETMLRDKLRVFVSCISPPLTNSDT